MSMGQERRKEESGKLVKDVYCDSYLLYLKYHGKPMGPDAWEAATRDMADMVRKYNGAAICGRMMLATLGQLEEETR